MKIQTYRVGQMQANCYFLLQGKDCIIIDPGDSAETLLEEVSRQRLNVHAIIATHGHFDHVMAAGEMQIALSVPFYIHPEDKFLLKRLEETAKHFLGYEPYVIKPQVVKPLGPEIMKFGPFEFDVIETPGHTPGSVCLYNQKETLLFVGDLLFEGGAIGRYDFAYSNKNDIFDSVTQIVENIPADTTLYCGHGEVATLGIEAALLRGLGVVK